MDHDSHKLSRRQFLDKLSRTAAVMPLLSANSSQDRAMERIPGAKPRNLILILSDDHRFDFMGFLGKPKFLETPNLDRMARQGAHLQNAFVTTSLCSPSRASILTGKFSHRHGVVDNNTDIPKGTVFFPQYLQQAGYETAFIGKWHMGNDTDMPRPGFDRWISFRGQGVYYDPKLNVDGESVHQKGYITDILTDYALQWLQQEHRKPYFLFLSHKAVHALFEPAPRHAGHYRQAPIEYPSSMTNSEENYRDKPRWVREQRNSWHGVDYPYHGQIEFDEFYRRYCETLLALDESIGRVLDWVDKSRQGRSTLVLYMGDNGFCLGEHGLIDKRHMYEESLRIPLLAWCPELIRPGIHVPQMVQNIDIAPTLLEAAGVKPPVDMDGRSLLPLFSGQKSAWRDAVFYEYYWERNYPQTPTVHGVRTDRHKYMHYHGIWDLDEFYDLQNDPQELHNLINSSQHQSLVQELNRRLFDWLEQTSGMLIPLRRDAGEREDKRKPGV